MNPPPALQQITLILLQSSSTSSGHESAAPATLTHRRRPDVSCGLALHASRKLLFTPSTPEFQRPYTALNDPRFDRAKRSRDKPLPLQVIVFTHTPSTLSGMNLPLPPTLIIVFV
jgi:hypothetical protein